MRMAGDASPCLRRQLAQLTGTACGSPARWPPSQALPSGHTQNHSDADNPDRPSAPQRRHFEAWPGQADRAHSAPARLTGCHHGCTRPSAQTQRPGATPAPAQPLRGQAGTGRGVWRDAPERHGVAAVFWKRVLPQEARQLRVIGVESQLIHPVATALVELARHSTASAALLPRCIAAKAKSRPDPMANF